MPSLRVGAWNIAGVRALGVDLLAVQEVDRNLAAAAASTSQRRSPRP